MERKDTSASSGNSRNLDRLPDSIGPGAREGNSFGRRHSAFDTLCEIDLADLWSDCSEINLTSHGRGGGIHPRIRMADHDRPIGVQMINVALAGVAPEVGTLSSHDDVCERSTRAN